MRYLGDFTAGQTVRFGFNTRQADGTPVTLAGTPAVAVYKDNLTTEATVGVTLTVDFDARTGSHLVAIDLSAEGTFYAAGSDFRAEITAGTVNGVSVAGTVLAHFSVENRTQKADVRKWNGGPVAHENNGLANNPVVYVGGSTTEGDTAIRAGLGLGLPNLDTQLSSIASNAGNAASRALTIVGKLTGMTSLTAWLQTLFTKTADATALAEINTGGRSFDQSTDSPEAIRERLDQVNTAVAAAKAVTDKLDTALELDGAVYRYTANALEQAPAAGSGGLTPAQEAKLDAVKAKTDLITTGQVTVVSPLRRVAGRVEVEQVRGDSYRAGVGRGALEWTDDGTWPDLAGASVAITVRRPRVVEGEEPALVYTKAGSVVVASGAGKKVRVELDPADTSGAPTGRHEYDVQATLADGSVYTLAGPKWPYHLVADQTT